MFPRAALLPIVLACFSLAYGCTYAVPARVSPAVNIYSTYDDKMPKGVVLVLDEDLKNVRKDVKPSSHLCSAHTFPVSLDSSLATSIKTTTEALFDKVVEQNALPTAQTLPDSGCYGSIYVKLNRFAPSLRFSAGLWEGTAIASCDLVLDVTVRDGTNAILVSTPVGGNRTAEGGGGGACEGGADVLSEAISQTIRDTMERYAERLGNNTKLRTCFGEKAKQPEQ